MKSLKSLATQQSKKRARRRNEHSISTRRVFSLRRRLFRIKSTSTRFFRVWAKRLFQKDNCVFFCICFFLSLKVTHYVKFVLMALDFVIRTQVELVKVGPHTLSIFEIKGVLVKKVSFNNLKLGSWFDATPSTTRFWWLHL